MTKLKSIFVQPSYSALKHVAFLTRTGFKRQPPELMFDDFKGEYRDVAKEVVAINRNNTLLSGKPVNLALIVVVERAVMRVMHAGKNSVLRPPESNILLPSALLKPDQRPRKSFERRADGSFRLRKLS